MSRLGYVTKGGNTFRRAYRNIVDVLAKSTGCLLQACPQSINAPHPLPPSRDRFGFELFGDLGDLADLSSPTPNDV